MPQLHLVLEHQHEQVKHCHSDVPHFHDKDYAFNSRLVCLMQISPSEPVGRCPLHQHVELVSVLSVLHAEVFFGQQRYPSYLFRAPPAVQA